MKALQVSTIAKGLVAVGLLWGNAAFAASLCEHLGRCENGCYTSLAKATSLPQLTTPANNESSGTCETAALSMSSNGEYVSYEVPLDLAPGPMALEWEKVGSDRYFEVWPQGNAITYSWSATGGIVLDAASGTANPIRGFSCTVGTQGTITVKAFSPSGASETLTQTVSCQ